MKYKQRLALTIILLLLLLLAGIQTMQLVELRARISESSTAWSTVDNFFRGVRSALITKGNSDEKGKADKISDSR